MSYQETTVAKRKKTKEEEEKKSGDHCFQVEEGKTTEKVETHRSTVSVNIKANQ